MREVRIMTIEIGESIMDMVIAERRSREKADSNVHSWQREIGKGDCFKRIADGMEIYGEVLEDYGSGEFRNFRECRCYSLSCPEGEIGSVHVATIDRLIDRKTFDKVKTKLHRAWKIAKMRAVNELALESLQPKFRRSCKLNCVSFLFVIK
jgi:hypothetical protein